MSATCLRIVAGQTSGRARWPREQAEQVAQKQPVPGRNQSAPIGVSCKRRRVISKRERGRGAGEQEAEGESYGPSPGVWPHEQRLHDCAARLRSGERVLQLDQRRASSSGKLLSNAAPQHSERPCYWPAIGAPTAPHLTRSRSLERTARPRAILVLCTLSLAGIMLLAAARCCSSTGLPSSSSQPAHHQGQLRRSHLEPSASAALYYAHQQAQKELDWEPAPEYPQRNQQEQLVALEQSWHRLAGPDHQQQPQPNHSGLVGGPAQGSTTPSLSRQLAPPPQLQQQQHHHHHQSLFELSFRPTNALQLESQAQSEAELLQQNKPTYDRRHLHQDQQQVPFRAVHSSSAPDHLLAGSTGLQMLAYAAHRANQRSAMQAAESITKPVHAAPLAMTTSLDQAAAVHSNSSSSRAERQLSLPAQNTASLQPVNQQLQQSRDASAGLDATGGEAGAEQSASAVEPSNTSNASDKQTSEQSSAAVEKGVEPRQRRRLFNRILKKAEWNHLFVELSKVFLRYFLDLALKDIIGKQSGGLSGLGSSSDSSSSSTSGRKKLDAQSELADLLRDFVKTAISNI